MKSSSRFLHLVWLNLLVLIVLPSMSDALSATPKQIYGVAGSGWTSSDWNWGSPYGTGHDCAMICRRRYGTSQARADLVDALLDAGTSSGGQSSDNIDFEEIKLVLALVWQKARRTGLEAFGVVLDEMAKAERYENGDDEACSRIFVQDIQKRYMWLEPDVDDKVAMNLLWYETDDYKVARCRCSGLVLKSIGFVESGL